MSEAYERELHRELSKLEGSFRQWQNEEIGSGELSYRLHQYEVGPSREFRGPKIPLLARRSAGDGFLNTAMIGRWPPILFTSLRAAAWPIATFVTANMVSIIV